MNMNFEWYQALVSVMLHGEKVAPRGIAVRELMHRTIKVDMRNPVLTIPERNLNYRFMAAEAGWILSGSDRLEDLGSQADRLRPYSDDGLTLTGAYGPRFVRQLGYVVKALNDDPDTRQATMTIWRPEAARAYQDLGQVSKDVPCTVAVDFKFRDGKLSTHVFMRSSDVWLGLPYDVFTFTMMACRVAELLSYPVLLGDLYLTAASSHIYDRNTDDASLLITAIQERLGSANNDPMAGGKDLPLEFYMPETRLATPGRGVRDRLHALRGSRVGDPMRWWERAA